MTRATRGVWVCLGMLLATAAAGCGAEESSADVQSYVDGSGRSCTTDANDISRTATCDADPTATVSCDGTQEASFVVDDAVDFETHVWTQRSCVGCIDRAEHHTYIMMGSCVPITCDVDDDCVGSSYACADGLCQHD